MHHINPSPNSESSAQYPMVETMQRAFQPQWQTRRRNRAREALPSTANHLIKSMEKGEGQKMMTDAGSKLTLKQGGRLKGMPGPIMISLFKMAWFLTSADSPLEV